MDVYPHLRIEREQPVNEKRPGQYRPPPPPADIRGHARRLQHSLARAREAVRQDVGGFDARPLFKLQIGQFSPEQVEQGFPGVEVVSQEDGGYALAFATQDALGEFEARLATLADGETPKYPGILYALQAFDRWTAEDRKGWALKRDGLPQHDSFMLDVELWPIRFQAERKAMVGAFENWLEQADIARLDKIDTDSLVLYRVRLNGDQAEQLLRHRDARTVDLPPRFGLELQALRLDIKDLPDIPSPPNAAPFVAILDSGIAASHPLLNSALADAQGFLPPDREAHDNAGHGTHVAGIALYGDVEECYQSQIFAPGLRLLSGRILDGNADANTRLIENVVEEAVRYFHEQYRCRVFNLSYGDLNKPYHGGRQRGLAYTLDRLSRELDILFIVPTGNFPDVPLDWLQHEYPAYLLKPEARLLDPAPALNVLTVGGIARWDQTANSIRWPHDPREQPIAQRDQPSPFSRCGASVKGAIKPELVAHGGNWALHQVTGQIIERGLGELSTCKDFAEGRVLAEKSGTSFAAPHIAHVAARLLDELPVDASMNLVRALLVANARTPHASIELFGNDEDKLAQTVGYGMVDTAGLYRSTEEQVILIAEAALGNKRHHFYEIPVPESFYGGSRRSRKREITVALAHYPPVKTTRLDYKAARLEFRLVEADSLNACSTMFDRDTPEDEYQNLKELNTSKAFYGAKKRSKGTVQASTWVIKRARQKRLFVVVTRNDFGWAEQDAEERYALVIRLSDRENEEARLYTQINARLQARERARVRV